MLRNSRKGRSASRTLRFAYLAGVGIGFFLAGVGAVLLIDPDLGGRVFGVAPTTDSASGLARSLGLRQLYLGLMVLALVATRHARPAGVLLTSLGVIPFGDFLIWLHAGTGLAKASEHLLGLVILTVGALLLAADAWSRIRPERAIGGTER